MLLVDLVFLKYAVSSGVKSITTLRKFFFIWTTDEGIDDDRLK